ncbi:Nuclear-export-signal (NES)-containing protein/polyadenylated-RNA export factor [Handroanthus impetiginosus]|uniref:mRNA export factor GLE1 n=1 Tax=Handroanthus impetiginosus TaxID=429701 RepID=A0A2G9G8U0_9LAMI|nr:Nuclear-export-signal (NES)-containing protein/polyadenylated-RNA export factor [Handroanthus impetiginosus]
MGGIYLGLRCPQKVNGIAADPQPDWSFDNLLSELELIDKKLNVTLDFPVPFRKTQPKEMRASKDNGQLSRGFVMHVSDDESDYSDGDSEDETENLSMVSGRRFACDELYMSDDSENAIPLGMQCQLMDKVGLTEGALHELTHELQLNVSEEVRSKISSLETELISENERSALLISKVEKHRESQQERERKFDLQYQRTIAEALDNHLTAVQRDHEHISQLEERRIKDDAAREEAKRRDKALQEEKLRQERIKAEEEARLKAEMAERAKAAAIEAEKNAAEEAAAKRAADTLKYSARNGVEETKGSVGLSTDSSFDVRKIVQPSAKDVVRASENALELEKRRLQIYEELSAKNKALKASANQDYHKHGQNIGRQIKTFTATVENIRTRAEELLKLINNPGCPQCISIQLFAEKIVSNCTNQKSFSTIFATCRVIVLVTSKIPLAMDILIAELNRVCIYTVPKHISYSEEAFQRKNDYFKAIGYGEENGKIESIDEYIERLSCYMKLYGALVQTEVGGFQNLHGLREGWAWLARFLNSLPANLYTAVALHSFLEMAGFGLHRRYKNQFEKLLRLIARDFLNALQEGGSESVSSKLSKVKISIQNYIESNQFKKEPEGLQLRGRLESNETFKSY